MLLPEALEEYDHGVLPKLRAISAKAFLSERKTLRPILSRVIQIRSGGGGEEEDDDVMVDGNA